MNYLGSKSHCKHGRQHNKVQLDFILSKLELEYTFLDTKRVLCRRSIDRLGSKNTKYTGIQGKPTRSLSDLKKKKTTKTYSIYMHPRIFLQDCKPGLNSKQFIKQRRTFRIFSYKCCKVFDKFDCLFASWPNPLLG